MRVYLQWTWIWTQNHPYVGVQQPRYVTVSVLSFRPIQAHPLGLYVEFDVRGNDELYDMLDEAKMDKITTLFFVAKRF
jgi:hypothetical protein